MPDATMSHSYIAEYTFDDLFLRKKKAVGSADRAPTVELKINEFMHHTKHNTMMW